MSDSNYELQSLPALQTELEPLKILRALPRNRPYVVIAKSSARRTRSKVVSY